eukprot:scpid32212/ scgid8054/ 
MTLCELFSFTSTSEATALSAIANRLVNSEDWPVQSSPLALPLLRCEECWDENFCRVCMRELPCMLVYSAKWLLTDNFDLLICYAPRVFESCWQCGPWKSIHSSSCIYYSFVIYLL